MGKTKYEKLEEKLALKPETAWKSFSRKAVYNFSEEYKSFITKSKTEREAYKQIEKEAKKHGFKELKADAPLTAGAKYYLGHQNKAIALIIIGKQPLTNGINILVSHIDSPRLDLKQRPLYEDLELGLFKTHYYGGIKKWHWVNHPLALHGIICTKKGNIEIALGEKETDPVFTVADLLPHLGRKQSEKTGKELIKGEELNILVGSYPVNDKKVKTKVKLALLEYLHKEYGIIEEDLISSELCAVPAGHARDVGFDRSLVGAYGHDDKSCTYASLKSILEIKKPERTSVAFFMDKEEIGSTGPTGSDSFFFENIISEISVEPKRVLENSRALSADVGAGVNPTYKDVHDLKNASFMGHGIDISKFTGSGGKYGSNDARAEYVYFVRHLLDKHKIPWQMSELGKVDEGGGGTIAMFIARYGCDVIDVGLPLLSMHSPFEIMSKVDLYALYKFYKVFLEESK